MGSVCRRHLHGEAGLLEILKVLDAYLPEHVTVHLFGVKGQAFSWLGPWLHRIESVDSMAWDFAARRTQQDRPDTMRPIDWRAEQMARWVEQQRQRLTALYRHAASEELMAGIVGVLQRHLPADISPEELDRFLDEHREPLQQELAQALPAELAQRALR